MFEAWRSRQAPVVQSAMLAAATTGETLQVRLACAPAVICDYVNAHGLAVCAEWQGQVWDILMSEDARPECDSGRWRCGICCDEGKPQPFDSLATLWADHFFDPLARWIEVTLRPAGALVLHQHESSSGMWAELVIATPSALAGSVKAVVPLHLGQCQSLPGG